MLTVNIHKGFTFFNRQFILSELRDAVRTVGADVVFLQEVTGTTSSIRKCYTTSPIEPHYEFLADSIWAQFAYGRNAVYTNGHHGNAVLSKFPIVRYENRDISISGPERRGMLHCELKVPGQSRNVHAICVHLGLVEVAPHAADELLCDMVRKEIPARSPVVVAGDFNDWRRRAHAQMAKGATCTRCSCRPTAMRRAPFRRACRCCSWTASMCATPSAIRPSCCPATRGRTCPTMRRWRPRSGCEHRRSSTWRAPTTRWPHASDRGDAAMTRWQAGNQFSLLENGEAFFPRVFECIAAARHEVVLETFILFEDKVGLALHAALLQAALARRADRHHHRRLRLARPVAANSSRP